MEEKIFTVDQAAEILGLHPKTVRRFIREGKFKATKVGKQWRILKDDLDIFLGRDIQAASEKKKEAAPKGEKIFVSTVVDIQVSGEDEALRLSNVILASMLGKEHSGGQCRSDYIYYKEEKKARFLLWGPPEVVGNLLILLSRIS